MSLEAEIKRGGLDRGRILYFPVAPGRVEFTIALRRLLLERRPQIVAVELPEWRKMLTRLSCATRKSAISISCAGRFESRASIVTRIPLRSENFWT